MTPRETAQAVTAADAEAREAERLIGALEDRVRDGDGGVTPGQLAEQRELGRFAKLRAEAARRKHTRAVEKDRDRRCKEAAQAARALLADDDTQPIIDAVQTAVAALEDLMRVAAVRNTAIADVGAQLDLLNDELRKAGQPGPFPIRQYGAVGKPQPGSVTVQGEGATEAVKPGEIAAVALLVALTGRSVEQDQARQVFNGIPDSVVSRVGKHVPGLAAAWRCTPAEWSALDSRGTHAVGLQGRQPEPPAA